MSEKLKQGFTRLVESIKDINSLKDEKKINADKLIESTNKLFKSLENYNSFLNYLKNEFFYDSADELEKDYGAINESRITKNEFVNPSFKLVDMLFNRKEINKQKMNSEVEWISIMLWIMKNNIIEPKMLAEKSHSIDAAIKTNKIRIKIEVANQIHLKLYGNKSQRRGEKGLYQSCPLAKAYHKYNLASMISKESMLESKDIYEYLTDNVQTFWNELTMKMSGGLTVIAQPEIRNNIIYYAYQNRANKEINYTKEENIKKSINYIGNKTSYISFAFLEQEKILDIIEESICY